MSDWLSALNPFSWGSKPSGDFQTLSSQIASGQLGDREVSQALLEQLARQSKDIETLKMRLGAQTDNSSTVTGKLADTEAFLRKREAERDQLLDNEASSRWRWGITSIVAGGSASIAIPQYCAATLGVVGSSFLGIGVMLGGILYGAHQVMQSGQAAGRIRGHQIDAYLNENPNVSRSKAEEMLEEARLILYDVSSAGESVGKREYDNKKRCGYSHFRTKPTLYVIKELDLNPYIERLHACYPNRTRAKCEEHISNTYDTGKSLGWDSRERDDVNDSLDIDFSPF